MTRPWLSYSSKAACEGGWEFYDRDTGAVIPLETVNAYIKAINGQDSLIPREYLRLHPELVKDAPAAAGGGQVITKAVESGKGGELPPLPPEKRPAFDPASCNPYQRGPRDPGLDKNDEFNPFRGPYQHRPATPEPEPARKAFRPNDDYLWLKEKAK